MKKNIKYLILSIFAFGLFSISPANAGDCSEEDPCGTWAVISETGIVLNIIVCQPSVCGSGTFDNKRVVLQVPANPVTHESQGGWLAPPSPDQITGVTQVTYNENKNEFTLKNKVEIVKVQVVTTNVNTDEESVDTLHTKVSINNKTTFIPTELTGTLPTMKPVADNPLENDSSATISVISQDVNSQIISIEQHSFDSPQTSLQIDEVITAEDYPLIKKYIGKIKGMLGVFIL
jgi:hypothetical protein